MNYICSQDSRALRSSLAAADADFVHIWVTLHQCKKPRFAWLFALVEARRVELLSETISTEASPGAVSV